MLQKKNKKQKIPVCSLKPMKDIIANFILAKKKKLNFKKM